jgi:hypothetical protein
MTDADRDAAGLLAGTVPVYAGAWGAVRPRDAGVHGDPARRIADNDLLLQTMAYFDFRNIS